MNPEIISTAYHEAGHAIAAYIVGWSINSIKIETENDRLKRGVTIYDFKGQENWSETYDGCYKRIYCLVGGPVAHAIYNDRDNITEDYMSEDGKTIDEINEKLKHDRHKPINIEEAINDFAPLFRSEHYWNSIKEIANFVLSSDNLELNKLEFTTIINKHNIKTMCF